MLPAIECEWREHRLGYICTVCETIKPRPIRKLCHRKLTRCNHLGEATGRTLPCSCGDTPQQVGVHECSLHRICTAKRPSTDAPLVPWCGACDGFRLQTT